MSSIHQSGEHMIRLAYKNSNKDEDNLMKNYLSKHGKLCKFKTCLEPNYGNTSKSPFLPFNEEEKEPDLEFHYC